NLQRRYARHLAGQPRLLVPLLQRRGGHRAMGRAVLLHEPQHLGRCRRHSAAGHRQHGVRVGPLRVAVSRLAARRWGAVGALPARRLLPRDTAVTSPSPPLTPLFPSVLELPVRTNSRMTVLRAMAAAMLLAPALAVAQTQLTGAGATFPYP